MADREHLTKYPENDYKLMQFSSYNRESVSPDEKGWYANEDMSHFIRVETNQGRREFVMFDTTGPGAVVRWWMTFYKAWTGTLRIYLDYDTVPVIQGSPHELLSGNSLAGPPFAVSVHKGVLIREEGRDLDHNFYIPLPFSKHCKITYECDSLERVRNNYYFPDVFYNICYRKYNKDTRVETFSMKALEDAKRELQQAREMLKGDHDKSPDVKEFSHELLPGGSFSLHFDTPNSAIDHILLHINAADTMQALRSTVISATFDGNETVWVPAGEFFGTGYRNLAHKTWLNRNTATGIMESYWLMPYRNNCTLAIKNYGKETVMISGRAGLTHYSWQAGSMYFGASWHEYYGLNTRNDKGDFLDLNFIDIRGKGIYAGDQITVFNTSYQWWGEGDEKIFVDGEPFPSSFGTGSEDYYGYGFGRPEPFSHPFIAQPVGAGNEGNSSNGGLTVNMRHRSLDAIPFHNEINAYIELWHWDSTAVVNYALTTYWYVRPPFEINVKPDIEGVRRRVARCTGDIMKRE